MYLIFNQFKIEEKALYLTSYLSFYIIHFPNLTHSMQQTSEIDSLTIEPQLDRKLREVQDSTDLQKKFIKAQLKMKIHRVWEEKESVQKIQQLQGNAQNEAITGDKYKIEENEFQTVQTKQTNENKHLKFGGKILKNNQLLVELSFGCQADTENPFQQFQVCIHKVDSRNSLSSSDQRPYQSNFTKSQINIPIEYKGIEEQDQKQNKEKLKLLESVNCTIRPSEDDDFYVRYLQQKWAKRQQEQHQMNQLITNLQNDYKKTKTVPNSVSRTRQVKQCLQQTVPNHQKSISTPKNKKTQFKVKKVQDKATSSISNVTSLLNTSKKLKSMKPFQNHSEYLDHKINHFKPYQYTRLGSKNLSNFEGSSNKIASKQPFYKNEIKSNVQYEISIGNTIEMMSRILQDRCYNSTNHQKNSQKLPQNVEPKGQTTKNVKKIIKRSPYGLLEIQVNDNRNNAKITNLRILKPKEMIKLKKIPNLVKGNKQNLAQKSITRLDEKHIGKKYGISGQDSLPSLNCSKK